MLADCQYNKVDVYSPLLTSYKVCKMLFINFQLAVSDMNTQSMRATGLKTESIASL